ncbi:MAG: AmmeMemoRadiSam system protein B [Dehalococcoidia bacterium]|jgi:AmmeMemoRadiSam system protein B
MSVSLTWRRAALGVLAVLAAGLAASTGSAAGGRSQVQQPSSSIGQPCLFFDEATFLKAVREADAVPQPNGTVYGGIIPHHWLAGDLITGFLAGLAKGDPVRTVVLIGPNHPNAGSARVLTSDLPWDTPFGVVEPDQQMIGALTDSGLATVEDEILATEHSVAGIMPAIKYYLPDAQVVPIILSGETTLAQARQLGEFLSSLRQEGTVFVASVDFSHYLTRAWAERHDSLTLDAIRGFDDTTLFTLDSGYLDSPPSIATLMAAMKALGADQFVLLDNTNSDALADDELAPTTSYITGYYRPGDSLDDPEADASQSKR